MIDTLPHTVVEVHKAMMKITAGKASGVCGIYPEYIQHGGMDALYTLHRIFTQVWEEEVVPEEWHQGITIALYISKCSNYRGITLLSVPGKVFVRVSLARIKSTLLLHRRPQQSNKPGRSTCNHIAILYNIA